jgi:hypothetical protein
MLIYKSLGHWPFSFSFSVVLLALLCTPTAPASEFDSLIFPQHVLHGKHFNACLLARYLAMDVLLLLIA